LPARWLAVPGNHDIPLFDLVRRVLFPRRRYLRHITPDLAPLRVLPGVRVLGLDTSRRKTTGILTPERLKALASLGAGREEDLRVLVTHHPLVDRQVEGHADALVAAAAARVDVLLAGHQHLAWHRRIKQDPGLGLLQVQAGTATSIRRRKKEPRNTYNVLRWDGGELEVELNTYVDGTYVPEAGRRFHRGKLGWDPVPAPD
jgi:predicted phosphodiesterase